jgi:hypothetical protein
VTGLRTEAERVAGSANLPTVTPKAAATGPRRPSIDIDAT